MEVAPMYDVSGESEDASGQDKCLPQAAVGESCCMHTNFLLFLSCFLGNTALLGANLLFEMLCVLPGVKTM